MTEGTAVAADKNVDLLKRGYKAFTTGDMDTLRSEIFQPDVLWHQPGDNPTAGDYRGVEQVVALFGNLLQRTDGTFKPWLNHYAAGEGLVIGVGATSATRRGQTTIQPYAHVCRVRDGKLSEAWILNLNQPEVDEFFRD